MTPLPKPCSESGRLHYYEGHLADSGCPGRDAGPIEEMQRKFPDDLVAMEGEGYAVALYWLDGETATVLFSKEKHPLTTEETREKAEAKIGGWAGEKGFKLNILEGYAEPHDAGAAPTTPSIDWSQIPPPQEGGGGTEDRTPEDEDEAPQNEKETK